MPRRSNLKTQSVERGKETLGQRLVRLRRAQGYSQAVLAERMGTIQRLISDYERDKLRPHPEMIIRFAKALNVTTDEILGLRETRQTLDPHLSSLWRRLKVLETFSESDRKAIVRHVQVIAERNKAKHKPTGPA